MKQLKSVEASESEGLYTGSERNWCQCEKTAEVVLATETRTKAQRVDGLMECVCANAPTCNSLTNE